MRRDFGSWPEIFISRQRKILVRGIRWVNMRRSTELSAFRLVARSFTCNAFTIDRALSIMVHLVAFDCSTRMEFYGRSVHSRDVCVADYGSNDVERCLEGET